MAAATTDDPSAGPFALFELRTDEGARLVGPGVADVEFRECAPVQAASSTTQQTSPNAFTVIHRHSEPPGWQQLLTV